MTKNDLKSKREYILELQRALMELAEIIDKRINKPLKFGKYKSIFVPFHEEFKEIVNKMPENYYFNESEDADMPIINEVVALTAKIKEKIEEIKSEE